QLAEQILRYFISRLTEPQRQPDRMLQLCRLKHPVGSDDGTRAVKRFVLIPQHLPETKPWTCHWVYSSQVEPLLLIKETRITYSDTLKMTTFEARRARTRARELSFNKGRSNRNDWT